MVIQRASPLDSDRLERLALRYVERFATTRGKLSSYLTRKLRERGWEGEGEPDPHAIAERMAALGYIDDAAYAEAKANAMIRRGLGARRITGALKQAGVADDDRGGAQTAIDSGAVSSALAFARRRRVGPFGEGVLDRPARERALAAMLRAGHGFDLSRRILALEPGELFDPETLENGGS
jgi:regulatory protein